MGSTSLARYGLTRITGYGKLIGPQLAAKEETMAHITNTGAKRAQGLEPIRPSQAGRNRYQVAGGTTSGCDCGEGNSFMLAHCEGCPMHVGPYSSVEVKRACFACGESPCECESVAPITAQVMRDVNRMFRQAIDRSAYKNGSLGMRLMSL